MSELGELIHKLRTQEQPARSITDLAQLLGISASYLSQIEKGHKCPAPEIAEKLSKIYGQTEIQRRKIFESLLQRIIVFRYPQAQGLFARGEYPNPHFLKRVKKDLDTYVVPFEEIAENLGVSVDAFEDILEAEHPITREQIFLLARTLGQNPTEYLLLAGFMPYETMEVLIGAPNLLKTLAAAAQIVQQNKES
ncbi:helix-turn-helix domain-containing protein [Geoalkalibacter subterraneus]|uniref:HTH cro/C1-type domain-containing protein n=1 Tax=Geoalkalibacter subterraneus TaxID=483547 RepID=A0A0B5FJ97_9BACT|nr:helix-turn-helix transcriptional regulator [Geoalkalibacter subterraneus]AJF08252.1 hypothetical protein GSUB_17370 [Geoalkalibacter subterraneus]